MAYDRASGFLRGIYNSLYPLSKPLDASHLDLATKSVAQCAQYILPPAPGILEVLLVSIIIVLFGTLSPYGILVLLSSILFLRNIIVSNDTHNIVHCWSRVPLWYQTFVILHLCSRNGKDI